MFVCMKVYDRARLWIAGGGSGSGIDLGGATVTTRDGIPLQGRTLRVDGER